MTYPIRCFNCDNRFQTIKLTASLRCARCASDDVDLDDSDVKTASSPGTGWNQPRPNTLEGWAVQPPTNLPGPNPKPLSEVSPAVGTGGTTVCPACKGTGYDNRASGAGYDEIQCRTCHGTGRYNPPTSKPDTQQLDSAPKPPVGSAAWTAKKVPVTVAGKTYLATVSSGIKALAIAASCPSCGNGHTKLARDAQDDAWWHCAKCGPLANLDKNPDINPFNPGKFTANRQMVTKTAANTPKTGTLLRKVHAIIKMNPGLTVEESLTLARASAKYAKNDR